MSTKETELKLDMNYWCSSCTHALVTKLAGGGEITVCDLNSPCKNYTRNMRKDDAEYGCMPNGRKTR